MSRSRRVNPVAEARRAMLKNVEWAENSRGYLAA